jgi:hypothetical protein
MEWVFPDGTTLTNSQSACHRNSRFHSLSFNHLRTQDEPSCQRLLTGGLPPAAEWQRFGSPSVLPIQPASVEAEALQSPIQRALAQTEMLGQFGAGAVERRQRVGQTRLLVIGPAP